MQVHVPLAENKNHIGNMNSICIPNLKLMYTALQFNKRKLSYPILLVFSVHQGTVYNE